MIPTARVSIKPRAIQQELSGTTPTANLLTGPGTDQYLSRTDSAGARYYLPDALGSTVALTDSTAAVQTSYAYEPFGNSTTSGANSTSSYQFTGRENDSTGLDYYRARYYSPTFQRFVSQDPIGFGGGASNLYAYTGDSPNNFTDPSGQIVPVVAAMAVGCLVGATFAGLVDDVKLANAARKGVQSDIDFGKFFGDIGEGCVAGAVLSGVFAVVEIVGAWALGDLAAEEGGGAVLDAAESCLKNSFSGDTPVTMADGTQRPIADIRVGDKVLATDPETGRTEARPVAGLIRSKGQHAMVDITLVGGSKLVTTDHHPFWDATTRTFTDAINLHVGDQLLSEDGHPIAIDSIHVYQRNLTAYKLDVDGIHTYYAGITPVLVHNSCDIANPESFVGAFRSEVEQELQANGWYNAGPTREGGGVRWRLPNNPSDQVRIMPGNSADSDVIKQGPYIRFSIRGVKFGPFPLADF